jgi:hypothetical protein
MQKTGTCLLNVRNSSREQFGGLNRHHPDRFKYLQFMGNQKARNNTYPMILGRNKHQLYNTEESVPVKAGY